ncbi:unnamed protein product, partial [Phaeothamnion confervicola]
MAAARARQEAAAATAAEEKLAAAVEEASTAAAEAGAARLRSAQSRWVNEIAQLKERFVAEHDVLLSQAGALQRRLDDSKDTADAARHASEQLLQSRVAAAHKERDD